jgi:hypothetical protein
MRWHTSDLEKIDGWRRRQGLSAALSRRQNDAPSRTEAIRRLVELALAGMQPPKPRSPKARSKALDLAGKQIDKLSNPSASAEERQQRRRL